MKTHSMFVTRYGRSLAASLLLLPLCARAIIVDWDGSGDANTSGFWENDTNWTADLKPTAPDHARLLDVTTGTREATIGEGFAQTLNQLTITQTTGGAFNVLNVDENLTISGTGAGYNPFVITATAGQDSIVTNIAEGKSILVTNSTDTFTAAYGGTVNVGVNGSFIVRNTAAVNDRFATATFAGPVTLAAGAKLGVENDTTFATNKQAALTLSETVEIGAGAILITQGTGNKNATTTLNGAVAVAATGKIQTITGNSSVANGILNVNAGFDLDGAIEVGGGNASINLGSGSTTQWNPGSTVALQYSHAQGSAMLNNAGVLSLDNSNLFFDWVATTSGTVSTNTATNGRRFVNSGEMTLENGSSLSFISTAGLPTSGFGIGFRNENTGTGILNVKSGSTVGFQSLYNAGTLNLGSSTLGVSDALVTLGSPDNTFNTVELFNGQTAPTPTSVDDAGTINILGNVWLGRTNDTATTPTTTLHNGSATSTGSVVNIGDGTVPLTFTIANRHATVSNYAGNTINLNAGATLLLRSNATYSTAGVVTLTNDGTFNHSGTLSMQGTFNGARTVTTSSTGTYRIKGTNATIVALPAAAGTNETNVQAIAFTVNGLLSGSSAHDRLTYTNNSGNGSRDILGITVADGEIMAGNGTNGSGVSSIGQLEFVNTDVSLAGTSKLSFDIGGLGNDNAPLEDPFTFDYILTEGTFNIGAGTGSVLDIWMVNGFTTSSEQSYVLIDATGGSVTGSFSTLLFQGQAVTNEYTVVNLGDRFVINLAAGLGAPIPEPSVFAVIAGLGALGFAGVRRRRKV